MGNDLFKWPYWMPLARQSGYGYEPADRRTRTDMEVGSVLRVNFDSDETTLTCSLVLNSFQAAWLEAFERGALRQGSQWFQMPLQAGGCIEWHTVRFASRPKAASVNALYTTYTLQLDLEKRELVMGDELAELLVCIAPEELIESVETVNSFVNGLLALQVPDFWIYGCLQRRLEYEYGLR